MPKYEFLACNFRSFTPIFLDIVHQFTVYIRQPPSLNKRKILIKHFEIEKKKQSKVELQRAKIIRRYIVFWVICICNRLFSRSLKNFFIFYNRFYFLCKIYLHFFICKKTF